MFTSFTVFLDVYYKLSNKQVNKHNGIPVKIFNLLLESTVFLLQSLFNRFWTTDRFPCSLKLINIVPVLKIDNPIENKSYRHVNLAADSCRDGWNVRNWSKILQSVGKSVDCVLLLALVLLSKHNYVILFWTKSIASVFVAENT